MRNSPLPVLACLLLLLATTGCNVSRSAPPVANVQGGTQRSEYPEVAATTSPQSDVATEQATENVAPEASRRQPDTQIVSAPVIVELPTEALAVWSTFTEQKPVLILMANNPFLQPVPAGIAERPNYLPTLKSQNKLRQRGTSLTTDPLLLPSMALSAALEAGFFSRVVWVLPSQTPSHQFDVELFRQQLQEIGASKEEISSFQLDQGQFSGRIRGVPLQAVHYKSLPPISEPALLHIDLSYFQPLYKGEIKTPLYSILTETIDSTRRAGWNLSALTISLSNLEGVVPLASRFVGTELAAMFRRLPLDEMPSLQNLEHRADALYLENFFQKDDIRELYLEMERKTPDDPSIKFALYEISRQFGDGEKALHYLHQAAQLDPVYGLEYLSLALLAKQKNMPEQVVRMLYHAAAAMPDNPFIALDLAETLLDLERFEEASRILQTLSEQEWSEYYYPQIPPILDELRATAAKSKALPPLRR